MVLLEAAACGIPAVGSDAGGIGEWIEDGVNGRLVPPADPALAHALADVLRQPERLVRMGQMARQKALQLSWPAVADRYAAFTFDAAGLHRNVTSVVTLERRSHDIRALTPPQESLPAAPFRHRLGWACGKPEQTLHR
jgi:hypothetical protein